MATELCKMGEDDFEKWWDLYKPTGTPVEGSGPCIGEIQRMFETFGSDLETVRKAFEKTPNNVWTMVECDDNIWVTPGLRHVNRLGYYITEVACPDDERDFLVNDH